MENINTGMIMDAVSNAKDYTDKNEAMQAAIDNDLMINAHVEVERNIKIVVWILENTII